MALHPSLLCLLGFLGVLHGGFGQLLVVTQPENLTAILDGSIVFLCKVNQDLVREQIQWFFVEHGIQITDGESILVNDDDKYSFMIPQDSPYRQRNLLVRKLSTSDQGHYRCIISGTNSSVTHHLRVGGAPPVPEITTPPVNFTDCCKNQAVGNACMPACVPATVTNETFSPLDSCTTIDLEKLLHCFADSRNHVACCARRLVPVMCQEFCTATPPAQLGLEHIGCLPYAQSIIACFSEGQVLLPTPPMDVSVLAMPNNQVKVNWATPAENSQQVLGYRVLYKQVADQVYNSSAVIPVPKTQYILGQLRPQTQYEIYMISIGAHGSSLPSPRQRIYTVGNETTSTQNSDIMKCCVERNIGERCRSMLCSTSTWQHFNPEDLINCYDDLDQVFPCLSGGQNHTVCCQQNDIPDVCLGLCSGQPPMLSWNLTHCTLRLPIIEACIQRGLNTLPRSPRMLAVGQVTESTAELQWTPPLPTQAAITGYQVQWRRLRSKQFQQILTPPVPFAELTNLDSDTEYEVQISSESNGATSLPSTLAIFRTYPNASLESPDFNNVTGAGLEHNITACCMQQGVIAECLGGCNYSADTLDFFTSRVMECYSSVTTILGCGSDGRNHTGCCAARSVPKVCHVFCAMSFHTSLNLGLQHLECLDHVMDIRSCYQEGIGTLPKHPEGLEVSNRTRNTISLSWRPPTATPAPTGYLIQYQPVQGADTSPGAAPIRINTTGTKYILQNLKPSTMYQVTVVSVNDAGTSSPIVLQDFTLSEDIKLIPVHLINSTSPTGRELWANRTHCCHGSGVSEECMGLCLQQDMNPFKSSCINDISKMLACASDGQNHTSCCQRRLVPNSCLRLCQGHSLGNDFYGAACLSYIAPITDCFLESTNLLPSTPRNFNVVVYGNTVQLYFAPSDQNCPAGVCTHIIHYWPVGTDISYAKMLKNMVNGTVVEQLELGRMYNFQLVARNAYGSSQPTAVLQVYIQSVGIKDVSILQSPSGIVPVGTRVTLVCDVIATPKAMVYWKLRGGRTFEDNPLVLNNVTQVDEGEYTCVASNDYSSSQSATIFLNLQYKPYVESFRVDSGYPGIGAEARLSCRFRGHPDPHMVTWTKDGNPWTSKVGKSFDFREARAHSGVMAATLKISKLEQSDYGLYRCNASNQFGYTVGALNLTHPDAIPALPKPANKQPNVTACCLTEGVSSSCMSVCTFDIDVARLMQNTKLFVCLQFLPQFAKCGADGRDHSQCCAKKAVTPYCMPFCVGKVPEVGDGGEQLMECGEQIDSILRCVTAGHNNIPSAPQNVMGKIQDGYLLVKWQIPANNPHKVEFYRISYKTPEMNAPIVHSVSESFLEYHITNIDSDKVYHVWVIAGNDFGESHASNEITVHTPELKAQTPKELQVFRLTDTSVQLRWMAPDYGTVKSYTVFYKDSYSNEYTRVPTVSLFIVLDNLSPGTEYQAYVTASNDFGTSSPSSSVHFQTGGEKTASQSSAGTSTAIGLGIGIPILLIAIAAAGIIVFMLIKFRRKSAGVNESVSFENPSYGPTQVQIGGLPPSDMQPENFSYGRLQEEVEDNKNRGAASTPASGAPSEQPNGCSVTAAPDDRLPVQQHLPSESKI